MDKKLLQILQHSVGVDIYGEGEMYRNHFCAGGKDVDLCRELVNLGFMVERKASELSGGSPCFHVTQQGKYTIHEESPVKPKLSRSKARYQRYLEYGDGFVSFIKYCIWDCNPERSWNGGNEYGEI